MEKSYQQREERLREVAGISGLIRSGFKPIIGHYIVRVVAVLNIADLIFGTYSTAYYRFSEAHLGKTIMVWYLLSSFALPLYVFGEAVILRKIRTEYKEILIDGIFAIGWFVALWGSALYSLFHTVWL